MHAVDGDLALVGGNQGHHAAGQQHRQLRLLDEDFVLRFGDGFPVLTAEAARGTAGPLVVNRVLDPLPAGDLCLPDLDGLVACQSGLLGELIDDRL